MQLGRFETWRRTDGAVDVSGHATNPAHHVMVVVADPCLVAGGTSRWFDPTEELCRREGTQRVVHGLTRDTAELVVDRSEDRLHVGVGSRRHLLEDGETYRGDTAARGTQKLDVLLRRHHRAGHYRMIWS